MGGGDRDSLSVWASDIPIDGVVTEGAATDAVDYGGGNGNSLFGGAGDIPVNGVIMEGAAIDAIEVGAVVGGIESKL